MVLGHSCFHGVAPRTMHFNVARTYSPFPWAARAACTLGCSTGREGFWEPQSSAGNLGHYNHRKLEVFYGRAGAAVGSGDCSPRVER